LEIGITGIIATATGAAIDMKGTIVTATIVGTGGIGGTMTATNTPRGYNERDNYSLEAGCVSATGFACLSRSNILYQQISRNLLNRSASSSPALA
jgi:hypothetical protein